MGYLLSLERARFLVPLANERAALDEARALHHQVFFDRKQTTDLGALFSDLAWPLERRESGWWMVDGHDVAHGWENALFERVAPFVEDGSFILARGEKGDLFTWVFMGGECSQPSGEIEIERIDLAIPTDKVVEALETASDVLGFRVRGRTVGSDVEPILAAFGWRGEMEDADFRLFPVDGHVFESDLVFAVLAPFARDGSWVEGNGRGGTCRWLFDGERCRRFCGVADANGSASTAGVADAPSSPGA